MKQHQHQHQHRQLRGSGKPADSMCGFRPLFTPSRMRAQHMYLQRRVPPSNVSPWLTPIVPWPYIRRTILSLHILCRYLCVYTLTGLLRPRDPSKSTLLPHQGRVLSPPACGATSCAITAGCKRGRVMQRQPMAWGEGRHGRG